MNEPILDERRLNRALLARQLLLERSTASMEGAIGQIGGLQTQYAPSGYVGLWTRLASFERADLTRALEDRRVIQATLMRATIHMVTRDAFWRFAMGVRAAHRAWAVRPGQVTDESAMVFGAERLRAALADGPRTVKELAGLASGFVGSHGLWLDLVRVPPSGTWERRRADRLGLAEDWVGPPDATEDEGRAHLVTAYLRAFGPAPVRDIGSWAGLPTAEVQRAAGNLTLRTFRDVDGRPLLDLPDAPLPGPDRPAPVRFLAHWDALLLVHARRTGVLPEVHRPAVFSSKNPFSVGTVLVDGRVAATWSLRDGQVEVTELEPIGRQDRDELEAERLALEAFHR